MDIYSIYRITNNVNGKVYVGWTSRDPLVRFEEHQKTRKPKYQDRSAISHAIEKYGVNSFTFEILYQSYDYDHSREIETHFITECNSLLEGWGYNIDNGGTGHKRTASTIEKHRAAIKGRKQSAEHIAKRNASRTKNGNPTAKTYIITHPNGDEEIITNLRQFAILHNLDPANLGKIARGVRSNYQHKGYKARFA